MTCPVLGSIFIHRDRKIPDITNQGVLRGEEAMKIKKGDHVVVITGDDESSSPRLVLQVLAGGQKMVIHGVNQVYKHVKRGHPKSPSGGRLQIEMPIQSSNVMYYCESCQKPTRLGLRYDDDGAKVRYCKKCDTSCGEAISPKRTKYAKAGS